jgi:HemK-related putative methylase
MSNSNIYKAAEDSELLLRFVGEKAFGRVLDMGTGSGILAFSAAKVPGIRQVVAVDINLDAVEYVSNEAKTQKIPRLKVLQSDLFSKVDGQFETIIFNPPYLPQDYLSGIKGDKVKVDDIALYGGKKGYETIVRFLNSVGSYLARGGKILLLFSSLSGKEVIDRCINENLLEFEELAKEKMPMMETLYVYEIRSLPVRESLVALGVNDLQYYAKGARGLVYKGKWDINSQEKKFLASKDVRDVAIKMKLGASYAPGTLEMEARNLRIVNKKGIGAKLYYYSKDFLLMEFVEGVGLDKFIELHGKDSSLVKLALVDLLNQARQLDLMRLNKEEMHRPFANVLVSELPEPNATKIKVTLLDFERCRRSDKPQNVTQVVSFLIKFGFVNQEEGIKLAEEYKKKYGDELFLKIMGLLD